MQLARGEEGVHRRAHRIGQAELDGLVALLQPDAGAGQGAAGADGADEAVDRPFGIGEDLGRRRLDMAPPVGDVVELVGPDRAARLVAASSSARRPETFT